MEYRKPSPLIKQPTTIKWLFPIFSIAAAALAIILVGGAVALHSGGGRFIGLVLVWIITGSGPPRLS